MYDVIVVGAGPAGLTAVTNLSHRGLNALVLEKQPLPGGLPVLLYPDKIIKDHPGFPVGILGKELGRMLHIQAVNSGAEIRCDEEVIKIRRKNESFIVETINDNYSSGRVLLCSGIFNTPRKLDLLKDYKGTNVHYKVTNPEKFRNKKIIIIGGGDNAFDTAVQLGEIAENITVLVRGKYAKAKAHTINTAKKIGVNIISNTELSRLFKDRSEGIRKVGVKDIETGEEDTVEADDIIVTIGYVPARTFLEENGFALNSDGTVKVKKNLETSIKDVFAAGDVNGGVQIIAVACAEGIAAAVHSFETIKRPYWLR
jgi:thioredoxin reductase